MILSNHDPQIMKCYWRCLNFHCYMYHVSLLHICIYIFNFYFISSHFSLFLFHLISFSIIDLVRDVKEEHNIVVNIALCWLLWPLGRIILLLMSCLTLFQLIVVETFCSPVHFLYSYLQHFFFFFFFSFGSELLLVA